MTQKKVSKKLSKKKAPTKKAVTMRLKSSYTNPEIPVGTILPYIVNAAPPKGWLLCNGKKVETKKYPDLEKLGITELPNLIGRSLVGAFLSSSGEAYDKKQDDGLNPNFPKVSDWKGMNLKNYGGEFVHTLSQEELPEPMKLYRHHRSFKGDSDSRDIPVKIDVGHGATEINVTGGKGKAHNNMPPYFAVHYIIYVGRVMEMA